MKVILTEKVPTLGNIGEIVNVSAGHARNYLVPNGFAMVADDSNKKLLAAQQKSLAKKIQAQKEAALELKKKVEGTTIELIKKVGASGKLFGTVTNAELSKELEVITKEAKDKFELMALSKEMGDEYKSVIERAKEMCSELQVAMETKDINKMNKLLEDANKISI
jgi:large subunit ribosomal protein L9